MIPKWPVGLLCVAAVAVTSSPSGTATPVSQGAANAASNARPIDALRRASLRDLAKKLPEGIRKFAETLLASTDREKRAEAASWIADSPEAGTSPWRCSCASAIPRSWKTL